MVEDAKKPRKERKDLVNPRHRIVLDSLEKNGGTLSKAMIAAGYAPSTAHVPKLVTGTKSWAMLMAEYLPEDKIAHRHSELLDKRAYRKNVEGDEVDDGPDTAAVGKALEMAYKLRGSFKDEKPVNPSAVVYNLFYKPEVRASVQAFEATLKQTIANESTGESPRVIDVTPGQDAGSAGPDVATVALDPGTPGS